ncbi:MAG TPA: ice-binding family protein, partial [Saprospiraceae bacterium]|nr:ice-binding family protein [Saprospiraceae bacterium]
TPDIYCLGAASVLNGDLVLDGQCDPSAFFIFQIDGALSTAVLATVTLINGASLCNVYWQVNGAVTIGDGAVFQGTIIAAGAITLLEGSSLFGRGLTTAGAIEMHNNVVSNEMLPTASVLVADGPTLLCAGDSVTLSGNCGGTWNTGDTTSTITVSTGGDYFVTNTNGCGLSESNHITVTVGAAPICTITGVFALCPGLTTELCVAAGYTNYLWSTGETSNCITVSVSGTYSVTIIDIDGCTSSCSQDVSIADLLPPVITCPLNISIECDVDTQPTVTGTAIATDDCDPTPSILFTDISIGGLCAQDYTILRTWIATDATGNTSTCEQTISIADNTAPVITCPVVISPIECSTLPSFGFPTAIDACDATVSFTFITDSIPGTCIQAYTLIRTWTATDDCGNASTCSATIVVEDTTAPIITCPADVTTLCTLSTDPDTTGFATAVDLCDPDPIITYVDDLSLGLCPIILTRTWTATDDCGNTSTCVQIIEASDVTPPVITCPSVISPIDCGTTPVFGVPTVIDDCDADVEVTSITDSIPGICGQAYTLIRTWTAIDDCGNLATCSSTIEVQDTTAPVITCPIILLDTIECGLPISFGIATAIDGCDVSPVITFSDVSIAGICPLEYSLIRTWIATDDCGNSSSCSATLFIQDNIAPVITCPIVVSPIECGTTPSFGAATAIDACDAVVDITFSDVTVQGLCPQEYSVTRTWTATDDCGNASTCSATITVEDNVPPVITCPVVISPIACGEIPFFDVAVATDACDVIVDILFSDVTVQGICAQEYTVTRTWIATDDCGNTATCSRTIDVGGIGGLIITCPPADTVPCASLVPVVDITLVQVSGNCGLFTVSLLSEVITNQSCLNSFTLTRTYQALDVCGNVATCSQIITVLDEIPPVITFINPLQINGDTIETACYGQDPEWNIPSFESGIITAADSCGGEVAITYSRTLEDAGDCADDGYIILYRLTWTATDLCGNSSSAFAFLALVDTIPPVIFGVPDDITVNCDDVPPPVPVYATDECLCACLVLFQQIDSSQTICQNGLVILRIWTAKDDCGNMSIDTQRITLVDEEGPELFFLQPEMEGLTDGTVIEYNCNEGGIPDYFDILNTQSINGRGTCGGSYDVSFTTEVDVQTNCEFFGYLEERIYHWTGTDLCSNTTSLTITIRLIDNEAPVITGVPDTACIGDAAFDQIEVSDDCDNVSLRYWDVNIPNPCGEGTARRRTYEATDDCGNIALDTTILLPNSLQVPVIFFTNPLLMQMDSGMVMTMDCEANQQRYTSFGVTDVRVVGACSMSSLIGFSETLLSSGDCADGGFVAVVQLRWTATDICGNVAERIMLVNITDESNPVFVNFSPVLYIGCNDSIPEMAATDNCGEVIMTHTDIVIPGACEYEYDIERMVTATDICGNTISRLQVIHVGNNGGPVITGVEEEICDDLTIPVVTAYDECADQFVDVTMQQDTLDITCRDGLVIQRTWTATDACGHTTVIHQTIIMNDQTPPVIYIPTYSVILRFLDREDNLVYQSQTGIIKLLNELHHESVQVYDDCDQVIIPVLTTDTLVALDCELAGYAYRVIYTWTATDICGNTASITFTVDIMDDLNPVFMEMPADTMIVCAPLPPVPNVVLLDSLENVTIVYTETIVAGPGAGQFTVTRTWTATDSCNNISTYIQHILWQPESTLECSILLPELVQCDSHGNIITSVVIGGTGPYIYEWEVVGEKCFIQGGQGTPEVEIYIGWSDVKVILTITDTFGCVTMCMTFLHCTEVFEVPISANTVTGTILVIPEHTGASPAIHVENEPSQGIQEFTLWPNPAKETINIGFESAREGMVEYSIMDYLGQTLSTNRIHAHHGYNVQQVDAAHLPGGSYLIQLRSEAEFYTKGIIIIRNE